MLKLATYNIHKGHSLTRGSQMEQIRSGLTELAADVVCLQEVQDINLKRMRQLSEKHASQINALQGNTYPYHAYGANAIYAHGHHGNAVLSKYPIRQWQNVDVSHHRLEQRGLLHAIVEHPQYGDLHVICVHFGLFKVSRVVQAHSLIKHVEQFVPPQSGLVIAGDFNDWNLHVHHLLTQKLGVTDAVEKSQDQQLGRTFPVMLPWFRLDRLYTRQLNVQSATVHRGAEWRIRSDHLPISAIVQ